MMLHETGAEGFFTKEYIAGGNAKMRDYKIIRAVTQFRTKLWFFGVGILGMLVCRPSIFLHAPSSICSYILSSLIISVPPTQGSPESETRTPGYSSPWTFGLANKYDTLSTTHMRHEAMSKGVERNARFQMICHVASMF